MKATETNLLNFLKKSSQFIVPIYQRTYSWTERECEQLWEDILQTGKGENISAHFIGSIVYIEKGLYHISSQSSLFVIDGQQRLTTAALIIEALARHVGDIEPLEGFSQKKLREYYLPNPLESGELRYKLLLTQTDKTSLIALLEQKPWPREHSIKIKENFEFFVKKIKELGSDDIKSLCKGLKKLILVDIALDRSQDKPQRIFESMNSKGKELSQADLIRNFILMDLDPDFQIELYQNHWRPMEQAFGQEAYSKSFDFFIRDYLTMKTKEIPNIGRVYEAFKNYAQNKEMPALIADIQTFADYYCAIALNQETDKSLKRAFSDLRELKVNVSYPFLLQVYDDYKKDLLSVQDFESVIRLVESYVFRRAVCNIPTNSLNKIFANFGRAIKKDSYLESIKAHFLLQSSYRRFPKDEEFFREIQIRDLYRFRSRSYWLRKLENYDRSKERVDVNECTIEHILPQNKNLSQSWQRTLGPKWKEIQEKYLHTLGNLTLTGYNSQYSDKPFIEKRDMKGVGFKESPLRLNEALRDKETWGENEIKERAEQLAKKAIKVWPLPPEKLEKYPPEFESSTDPSPSSKKPPNYSPITPNYSIESYPPLSQSNMRSLFKALQREVLALDSCVEERFRPPAYIAYSAERTFIYLRPQTQRLQLFLGLNIHELHDPKEIARDASHEHFGACDVRVDLSSLEELPYVLGLIRQALEKQIGNSND